MKTIKETSTSKKSKNVDRRNLHHTSIDVAKLAGVSQATVSRAFNPSSRVSPETRKKVLDAATELNYSPDAIAKSLISNSTNIVAVIMYNPTNPFYAKLLTKLSRKLYNQNKQILYFYLDDLASLNDLIHRVLQYRVDGIIITSATLAENLSKLCNNFGVPVILFNRLSDDSHVKSVCCDNFQAGKDCADYFCMKGYQNFAFIGGSDEASTSRERKRGFLSGLKERGIQNVVSYDTDFTYAGAQEAFKKLMKESTYVPDAIFCVSDLTCAGVMDCARYNFNINIPEDMACIGFDDIDLASYSSYNITSFVQPMDDMVNQICDYILNPDDPFDEKPIKFFPCKLISRGTA